MNKKTYRWTCSKCGSENVQQAVWINPNEPFDHPHSADNAYEVTGDYGIDTDGYCCVCEEEIPLKYEES